MPPETKLLFGRYRRGHFNARVGLFMRVYRAYLTDDGGRFAGVKFLNCESDKDALRTAEQFAAYSPVHVWDRDRFIQTVERHKRGGLFARILQRLDRGRPV